MPDVAESEAVAGQATPVPIKRKSSFIGDVLKLVGGTALAQALSMLVAPILSRLYAPDVFGTAEVFASITGIIGIIACLRYELAIMLPERDEDAANLLAVSLSFVLVVTGLSAGLVLFAGGPIVRLLNAPDLASYLWLVPLAVLLNGGFLALNYWNSRTKHFGRLSIAQVSQSVVTSGAQLGMGVAGQTHAGGLIKSRMLGSVVVTAVLGGQIWRDDGHLLRHSLDWRDALSGLRRHYKFPLYSTWTALLNSLSWQLPVVMLAAFFSPTIVGFYTLGNRVVRLPMILMGSAIAQVFFQRAAEVNIEGRLSMTVESVFRRLVSFGLFPMLLLMVTGRDLFVSLFGERWAEAGVYAQILGVYMFFNFIAAPLGQLFSVLERQEVALVTNILLLLSRFGALWLGGRTGDIKLTLSLFSVSGVLVYGGYSMWILRAAGVSLRYWWLSLFRSTLVSGILLGSSWLVCFSLDLHSWSLLAVYGAGAVLYYVWLITSDYQLSKLIRRMRDSTWRA